MTLDVGVMLGALFAGAIFNVALISIRLLTVLNRFADIAARVALTYERQVALEDRKVSILKNEQAVEMERTRR